MGQETPQAPSYRRVNPPPHDGNFVYSCVHVFATCVIPIFARFKVEGYENMPLSGGCVLTCNHAMGPDFLAIGYGTRRKIYFMAKQELFEVNPALTWLFNVNGTFPIKRGELDMAAIDHALNLVKEGHVLGMFPEGTRSRTGKLQRGRSGAARIAIQAQVPVVPAYVSRRRPGIQAQQLSEPEAAHAGDSAHRTAVEPSARSGRFALLAQFHPADHGSHRRTGGRARGTGRGPDGHRRGTRQGSISTTGNGGVKPAG